MGVTVGAKGTDATMVVCATVGARMVGEVVAAVRRCQGGEVTGWRPSCVPRHRHHLWAPVVQW